MHLGCLSLLLALCLITGLEPAAEGQASSCHSSTIISSLFKPGTISKKLPERSRCCADNPACNYTSSISHPSVLFLPRTSVCSVCSRLRLPSQPMFRKTADLQSSNVRNHQPGCLPFGSSALLFGLLPNCPSLK